MPVRPRRSTRPSARATRAAAVAAATETRQAVLYARVSSRAQEREGFSIPAQHALLRDYAASHGMTVVEEFTDVETAKRSGRSAFGQMLALLKKRLPKPPVILVEKTDRLYRNLKDWVTLDEMGVDIHFVKEGVVLSDSARSSDKFIHGIKVLMAKNYVDNLTEEIRKGMKQKCEEGGYPSIGPVGYVNRRENGRSHLELDPERALLVRTMFETYDRGQHSVERLVDHAQAIGLHGQRGGTIGMSAIHRMLRNPIYAGRFFWGGKEFASTEPMIISPELFQRVQDRMDGRPYTRARNHDFAFSGLVTCAHCGWAVVGELKKERYIYYHCVKRCQRESFVNEATLSRLFCDQVKRLVFPEAIREAFVASLRDSRRDIDTDLRVRASAAQARAERLGKLIAAAYEDKLEGRIDDAFFQGKRADWERQRFDALEEAKRLATVDAKSMDVGIQVFELANRAYDLMIQRSAVEQRQLLEVLVSNCTLGEGRLTMEWRKPFDVLVQSEEAAPLGIDESDPKTGGPPEWWRRRESNPRPK